MDLQSDGELHFTVDNEESALGRVGNYYLKGLPYEMNDQTLLTLDQDFMARSNNSWSPVISALILFISSVLGSIGAIPLASYDGQIEVETTFEFITCIFRAICGAFIFMNEWYCIFSYCHLCCETTQSELLEYQRPQKVLKGLVVTFFAGIYTLPYVWTYWEHDGKYFAYPAAVLYFLSLNRVYYRQAMKQFPRQNLTRTSRRKETILLQSLAQAVKICDEHPTCADHVAKYLIDHQDLKSNDISILSLFFAVNDRHLFYQTDHERLTNQYEEDFYDRWQAARTNILNIFIGVIYVSLVIMLVNQYEKMFAATLGQGSYLIWMSLSFGIVEGLMFILGTYDLHHAYLAQVLKFAIPPFQDSIGTKFLQLLRALPAIGAGVILAMTQLQMSYISYAKLATLLQLSKDLGYFIIGLGMALPFLLEMGLMIRTISTAWSIAKIHFLTSWLSRVILSYHFPHLVNSSIIRAYAKDAKKLVRMASDEGIEYLTTKFLHRG
ncbi:Hypothetical protein POVR1_LOCUS466 [uncultured virus]|nr:Hypothetical protein POVR1_LOCUS466 [uncultured virus]